MFYPFIFFLLIYLVSFFVVVGASDWVLVWLGLEMNMIGFLTLMYDRRSVLSVEVCMSYFFVQGVASALFVVISNSVVQYLELMSYLVMMVSVGGGPFYYWLVCVFLGLDWVSGGMLVVLQKVLPFWVSSKFLGEYVYLFALISLLVGAVGVFNQVSVKFLMIYSSVHHLGWMMVSMMVSWELWVLYIVLYSMMVGCVFYFLSGEEVSGIYSWLGVVKKWIVVLGILNMGGIPPMLGFFLKMHVLFCLWEGDSVVFLFLVVISIMVLYVYLRLMYDGLVGSMMDLGFSVKLELERVGSMVMFSLLGTMVGAGLVWGV